MAAEKTKKEVAADCARGDHNHLLVDGTPSGLKVSCKHCGCKMVRYRGDWLPVGKTPKSGASDGGEVDDAG